VAGKSVNLKSNIVFTIRQGFDKIHSTWVELQSLKTKQSMYACPCDLT